MLREPHNRVIPERLVSGIFLTTKEDSRQNPAGMTIYPLASYITLRYITEEAR